MKTEKETINKANDLKRKAELTRKSRHAASRRLRINNTLSQITIAMLSASQISSSISIMIFHSDGEQSKWMNFYIILSSILTLCYSLIISMGDFSSRSYKMHECGIELDKICNRINLEINSNRMCLYAIRDLMNSYHESLLKFENHTQNDYSEAEYKTNPSLCNFIKMAARKLIHFSHYFLAMGFAIYTFFKFLPTSN
ncbi:MAG: SLATT domain-containing protein [Lautropia sp.]|nr:SLATT domain-containing protein [Lautropia sp.]